MAHAYAAPEQGAETLRPFPVALVRIEPRSNSVRGAPSVRRLRVPFRRAGCRSACLLRSATLRPASAWRTIGAGCLPGGRFRRRRDDERGRLRPARRDLARLFVAALRQLDRREIMARHAGVAGGFAVADEDRPHVRHLSEYLAMRAKAREAQRFVVGLGVDQHQIGLDVAIAVARPIAAQIMVAVFGIKRRVGRERGQDRQKIGIEGRSMPALDSRL